MNRIVPVTLTSYWPYDTHSAKERLMEGEPRDRKGRRLITLQDHLADPTKNPYCSVAGDWTIWPYGQLIELADVHAGAVFRITDTGGNFYGPKKKIRNAGCEPLDICVAARTNNIGPIASTAVVIEGDFLVGRA